MLLSAIAKPQTDPTRIFERFRDFYSTELLAVAATDFNVFGRLAERPKSFQELRSEIGLAVRPANVLFTALRALDVIVLGPDGKYDLTAPAREHLVPGAYFEVGGYIGLVSESPGVRDLAERLMTNKPAGNRKDEQGASYIFREGMESAMDRETSARRLTLALAGRAKNCAPYLAQNVPLDQAKILLDVGGGSGIYSIALLQKNPNLRAIIWDRPEVLKVAQEMGVDYGVSDRLRTVAGDMFVDTVPTGCDAILLSNILHDWDTPECDKLVRRCADELPKGGRLLIHDVFLDDDLGGPLSIALYSTALFALTEGRAYSGQEYATWLSNAGLEPAQQIVPTSVNCGVLEGKKAR